MVESTHICTFKFLFHLVRLIIADECGQQNGLTFWKYNWHCKRIEEFEWYTYWKTTSNTVYYKVYFRNSAFCNCGSTFNCSFDHQQLFVAAEACERQSGIGKLIVEFGLDVLEI